MASGTITLTKSGGGNMFGQIVWSATSNGSEKNTSTVTASIQVKRPTGSYTLGTWKGSLTVGGTTQQISYYARIEDSWVTLGTVTATVSHNANGSGTCYIYGIINGPATTSQDGTNVSGSDTVTLDTIPRQAEMTSATDFNDKENPRIKYTNPLGAAVPSLQAGISLTGTSTCEVAYRNVDKTAGTDTLELTEAEMDVLRAAVTGSNSRTVWIYLRTRIGETYFYSPLSVKLTIKNPEPTINPTIVDSNSKTIALTDNSSKLIRYYSNAAVTIGAAAVKKASLTSQKVTCGGSSLTANGTINAVQSDTFVFTATDNRGNTTDKTVTVPFVDYVKLTCKLGNNMPTTDGDMTVGVSGNYFNGSFGAVSNTLAVYYRYKIDGGAWIKDANGNEWHTMTATKSGNAYTASASLTGLDYQTLYIFEAKAEDKLATVPSGEKRVKATPVFDWSGSDFKFNVPVYDKFGAMVGNGLAAYSGGGDSGIDPNTTLEDLCLTSHSNGPQGLGTFYYIGTVFYNTKSVTAARAQMAMPYSKHGSMYHRYFSSGSWSSWARYMTADEIYPVGSVVIRYDNTSPATLFGGTWQRIESRMLFGCASSGTVGATGSHTTGNGGSTLPYVNVAIWRRTA